VALKMGPRRVVQLLLVGVAAYTALWGGEYSAFGLRRLERRHAAEQERLAALRQEVDSLKQVAQRLEKDDATIERVARERFGMLRQGERLYRFVPVAQQAAPTQSETGS
jgi:cell division protein FtsB